MKFEEIIDKIKTIINFYLNNIREKYKSSLHNMNDNNNNKRLEYTKLDERNISNQRILKDSFNKKIFIKQNNKDEDFTEDDLSDSKIKKPITLYPYPNQIQQRIHYDIDNNKSNLSINNSNHINAFSEEYKEVNNNLINKYKHSNNIFNKEYSYNIKNSILYKNKKRISLKNKIIKIGNSNEKSQNSKSEIAFQNKNLLNKDNEKLNKNNFLNPFKNTQKSKEIVLESRDIVLNQIEFSEKNYETKNIENNNFDKEINLFRNNIISVGKQNNLPSEFDKYIFNEKNIFIPNNNIDNKLLPGKIYFLLHLTFYIKINF